VVFRDAHSRGTGCVDTAGPGSMPENESSKMILRIALSMISVITSIAEVEIFSLVPLLKRRYSSSILLRGVLQVMMSSSE
jgi:hypothetical protein